MPDHIIRGMVARLPQPTPTDELRSGRARQEPPGSRVAAMNRACLRRSAAPRRRLAGRGAWPILAIAALLWLSPTALPVRPAFADIAPSVLVSAMPKGVDDALSATRRQLDLQLALPDGPPQSASLQLNQSLLWIALVVGAVLLLYSLRDLVPMWRSSPRTADWEVAGSAAEGAAPGPLATAMMAADEVAAQGRFVEAMHVLLLHALTEMRRRRNEHFADSLTSREILRSTRLPEEGRTALRDIVARVEWSYFGEHPADQADYQACRASFDALAQALAGVGAAGA
jgi:hypothetical protein